MAKRKKKASKIGLYIALVQIVLIVLAACTLFTDGLTIKLGNIPISTMDATFGTDLLKPNTLVILGYVSLVIGFVLVLASAVLSKKISKILNLVSVLLLVFAGVTLFMFKDSFISANNVILEGQYELSPFMIVGGISAIAAGVGSAARLVLDK